MASFTAAVIQVSAGNDMETNIAAASDLIRRARDAGAELIAAPENVSMIEVGTANIRAKAAPEAGHPALAAFRALARETGAWLLAGSLTVKLGGDERLANRSYLLDPSGGIAARYDKIHMFDVNLPNGETYRESKNFRPGEEAVLAALPWGLLGMTVCYDLRFPQLYRALAQAGASLLSVPSAFMRVTGQAHWHVLLRARAIETGCFVLAPAQCGTHVAGRKSYGHSLIVAPWGEVLADAGEEVGFVTARLDTALVEEARHRVPSLEHDRPFRAPLPASGAADAAE